MAITEDTLALDQRFKQDLRSLSDAQVVALVTAWVTAWETLEPDLDRVALEVAAGYPDGATAARLRADARVVEATGMVRDRLDALVEETSRRAIADIPVVADMGSRSVVEGLRTQLPAVAEANRIGLATLSTTALSAVVERSTSQITSRLRPLPGAVTDAISAELVRGIAAGANPREVASRIVDRAGAEFSGGMARAATIARTEMLDAYRVSDQQTAILNQDVLVARVWIATLDARTCMSCVAQHGTEYPPDAFGPEDHPNGRCTFISKLRDWDDLGVPGVPEPSDATPDARAWFDGLTEDTQRAMLGPGKYDLWSEGRIGWDDLSVRRENPDWRAAHYERPLRDMRGESK